MASYNGVQAAVLSRPGCRLILAMSLLMTKSTRMAGDYSRSYSQVLCRTCQHWGLAEGSIVTLASTCRRRYLWAVLYIPPLLMSSIQESIIKVVQCLHYINFGDSLVSIIINREDCMTTFSGWKILRVIRCTEWVWIIIITVNIEKGWTQCADTSAFLSSSNKECTKSFVFWCPSLIEQM